MSAESWRDNMVERRVTYTLEKDGNFVIVENAPARVCVETGEQFFAPETVDQLQRIVWEQRTPSRVVQTPVYEFAA